MGTEILRADLRLRRVTAVVLALAVLLAMALVFAFHAWMNQLATTLPTDQLVARMRRAIGFSVIAMGLCVLLLAGYTARLARRAAKERRWPLGAARVLRDTPIRRDQAALRIVRWLDVLASVLVLFGIAATLLSWRLFAIAH